MLFKWLMIIFLIVLVYGSVLNWSDVKWFVLVFADLLSGVCGCLDASML